jgi:gamma-glutamyltranspeptidase / glutathione hydrolase
MGSKETHANAYCRLTSEEERLPSLLHSAFRILHSAFVCVPLVALLSTTLFAGSQVTATHAALATVSPAATQVGLNVLRSGGNAVDAAVAVSFALSVVHPQAGNIGGGGFLVYYDSKEKAVWTLDFREVAPLEAKRDMYLKADGSISTESQTGPLAVGVPGTVAGLEEMHRRFGSRPWRDLVAPAIELARSGVRTDLTLTADLAAAQRQRHIDQFAGTAALFYPNGKPLPAGSVLVQRELGDTLERIAQNGAAEFYQGSTASRLVSFVRGRSGLLSLRDLREYRPVWRAPIRIDFGPYQIFSMAPPSAGGFVLAETLGILNGYNLASFGFQTAASIHLMAEAERRAYIDRARYLGDPAEARIPYRELLSDSRARLWQSSIEVTRASSTRALAERAVIVETLHTTHFSIVDESGNIAAVTTTLNDDFGSGVLVEGAGFLLNNEMDDFTAAPEKPNRYGLMQSTANSIAPGKRMVSSMAPTIIFRNREPWLVLGTRGGPTIPTSVLQVFLNIAVFKKSLAEAIAAPRYHEQAWPEDIYYESGRAPESLLLALGSMGHGIKGRDPIGDIEAVIIESGVLTAVSDPRAGGAAGGY